MLCVDDLLRCQDVWLPTTTKIPFRSLYIHRIPWCCFLHFWAFICNVPTNMHVPYLCSTVMSFWVCVRRRRRSFLPSAVLKDCRSVEGTTLECPSWSIPPNIFATVTRKRHWMKQSPWNIDRVQWFLHRLVTVPRFHHHDIWLDNVDGWRSRVIYDPVRNNIFSV